MVDTAIKLGHGLHSILYYSMQEGVKIMFLRCLFFIFSFLLEENGNASVHEANLAAKGSSAAWAILPLCKYYLA